MDAVTSHNSETTESTPMNLCLSLKWNASISLPELRLVFLNALIAFKTQGALTFRLEDLNSEPASNEQIQKLKTELAAFNQDHHSFYLQSKHKNDYNQSLDQLIQAKKAYPCYCSPEALDEERRRLLTQGKMYRYNGVCRELTSEKIKEHESRGVSPIIRLRVDRQILKIQDQVLGELIYDTDPIGDFILQGATGKLTADFLTVVDYLNLQITQVVCGEDEKEALARQHLIYQAFNQPPPQVAHIPLLLSAEKKLLSSKKDAIPFEFLQQEGYLNPALFNYLSLLGWAIPDLRKIFSFEEIARRFELTEMSKVSAVFDWEKLKTFNAHYLKQLSFEELHEAMPRFSPQYSTIAKKQGDEWVQTTLLALKDHVKTLKEIGELLELLLRAPSYFEPEAKKLFTTKDAHQILKIFLEVLPNFESIHMDNVQSLIQAVKDKIQSKFKNPYTPLRAAITGLTHGPDLACALFVLGKEESQKRAEYVLKNLQHPRKK